jgi:hypothetical protein
MNGLQLISALLVTLLSGGLVGVLLKYKLDGRRLSKEEHEAQREERRDDFQIIVDLVTRQRDEAYAKIVAYDHKFELLELEVQGLRLARDLDPFPHWIIDLEGRYLFVNREFEKQFLEPKGRTYRDMIGKKGDTLWSAAFCRTLDRLAIQSRERADGKARATVAVDGRQVTVHKFPVRIKAIPVAYAGYITHVEDLEREPTARMSKR